MRTVSVGDILSGNIKLPFASRNVWKANQLECPDLRRVKAHLTQGTRPSKKLTNIHNVKRYLNIVSIARDGLLVAKYSEPLVADRECIVVPRPLLPGLLTALHIKLQHPSMHQLRKVVKRYFFALDMDAVVKEVSQACHQCASLRNVELSRTQRDQFTGLQVPLNDRDIIRNKHVQRNMNHPMSEKAKCPKGSRLPIISVEPGDLVYLNSDKRKDHARERYLVVGTQGEFCTIRKFVGSQLRSAAYSVRKSECFRVPCRESSDTVRQHWRSESSEDSDAFEGGADGSSGALSVGPQLSDIPNVLLQPEIPTGGVQGVEGVDQPGRGPDLRRSARVRRPPAYLRDYIT